MKTNDKQKNKLIIMIVSTISIISALVGMILALVALIAETTRPQKIGLWVSAAVFFLIGLFLTLFMFDLAKHIRKQNIEDGNNIQQSDKEQAQSQPNNATDNIQASQTAQSNDSLFCSQCGTKCSTSAIFCAKCGAKLQKLS